MNYTLMQDISDIESIRIYSVDDSEVLYNYSDPDDPCGELLGEIPSEQFAEFSEELLMLSFHEDHLIILFPVTYDPNFYYGNQIIKVEYLDGGCELISCCIQRQFKPSNKYPNTIRYCTDYEQWLAFLQNWVDLPDSNNK